MVDARKRQDPYEICCRREKAALRDPQHHAGGQETAVALNDAL